MQYLPYCKTEANSHNMLHLHKQFYSPAATCVSFHFITLSSSTVDLTIVTTSSGVSVTVLLLVLCLGLAMMFVHGVFTG